MKNLFLIATLILTVSSAAQHKKSKIKANDFTPEEMATLQSKRMTLQLDLTNSQQQDVYQLFLKKVETRQANKAERETETLASNKADKYNRMNAALDQKIETKTQLKSILSNDQYEKWEKSLKRKRKKSERKSRK